MGPDCTEIFFFFLKEQLSHRGFHFCFANPVTSLGIMAGREVSAQVTPGQVGGSEGQKEHLHWFLCSVRKNQSGDLHQLCSQEENASPLSAAAGEALRAGLATTFCLNLQYRF